MPLSWSIFDVIGPIMMGPSSSHTAGACQIGYMAQAINGKFKKVDILLHGSFADVYEGHCTDIALLAGLLNIKSFDERLKIAKKIAEENGIEYNFIQTDLGGDYHPNTARFIFDDNPVKSITGSSIGGGKAIINQIGKININVSLEYSTLIIHSERDAINTAEIVDNIQKSDRHVVNINTGHYKNDTITAIEIKEWFTKEDVEFFEKKNGVNWAKFVNHLPNFEDIEI